MSDASSVMSIIGSVAGLAGQGGGGSAGGPGAGGPLASMTKPASTALAPVTAPPVTGNAVKNPVLPAGALLQLMNPGGGGTKMQAPAPMNLMGGGKDNSAQALASIASLAALLLA